jgi:RHS repeat-associated protein
VRSWLGSATDYVSPKGQRLRKSDGSTGTTYFAPDTGNHLLAEDDNGAWVDYVWLNGRLVDRIAGGAVDAIHDDQTGRPQVVTAADQAVVWKADNGPFDRTVVQDDIGGLNLGFPGQYYDAERWLWNNGYRDYNAGFGRYNESDPLGLKGGVNSYIYVKGNPLSFTDPLGLSPPGVPPPMGPFLPPPWAELELPRTVGGYPTPLTPAECTAAYNREMDATTENEIDQLHDCDTDIPNPDDPNGPVMCRVNVGTMWWASDYVARRHLNQCMATCK